MDYKLYLTGAATVLVSVVVGFLLSYLTTKFINKIVYQARQDLPPDDVKETIMEQDFTDEDNDAE